MVEKQTKKPFDIGTHSRRIKSFVMRAGRTTLGQERALAELGPHYLIPYRTGLLDWQHTFAQASQNRLRILEIGFGMGETTAHIAQLRPDDDFLAVEVHEPGVGALLKKIGEEHIQNIRIIRHDAVDVLDQMIADDSLDGVHIFFPDPWHKKKHNKRRLVQPDFIQKLCSKMKAGGYVHMATDWEEYALQMLKVLNEQERLQNTSKTTEVMEDGQVVSGFAQRPSYRPITKFENRGLKLGHGVWDLVFVKKHHEASFTQKAI
jgi:tRNA (guanine-N7-)-methyltransferase